MILLVGSTGLVGGMIARALLDQARPLRILVRSGSNQRQLVETGAEATLGDLKDPRSLGIACRGIDTVITTASAGERGGDDTPRTVDFEGNRSLIQAARDAGVNRFLFVSALTASVDHPVPLLRAKAQTELTLRDSAMTYTVLAANCIMDVMFPIVFGYPLSIGRPVTLVGEGRRLHTFVAARDVAAFTVAAIDHPAASNRRIAIGGPEALSLRDVISAYERALGRPIPVEWVAPGELVPDLPPVPGLAELISGLLTGLEMFDSPVDMTEISRTLGVAPTSVTDFVASQVGEVTPTAPAAGSPPNAGAI